MSKLLLFLSAFFISLNVFSQHHVTGTIHDASDRSAITGASAVLLRPDSSIYKGNVSDTAGHFSIDDVASGLYILKVSFIGYENIFRNFTINENDPPSFSVSMKAAGKTLKDVVVEDKAPTAVQKGDTTQYNASSYKTNPDATAEDLLAKMPGVTSQDGKVQAHGEDVKKILVDGKPFFGDDPNAVLKNLPAEVIDKIQVFDQQSDQSKFTGVTDGNTIKTINIITKSGMKNGTFGRFFAGYGYDNVYKAGANINFFHGNRRITIIAQSNNINEQNFSADDLAGITAGSGQKHMGGKGSYSGGGSYGGGGPAANFTVNAKNGIATTHAAGINFTDKWNKTEIAASYFFNYSDNVAQQATNRSYVLPADSGRIYRETSYASTINMNHRMNLRLEWKPDTNNAVTFTPKMNFQQNNGLSNVAGSTTFSDTPVNSSSNNYRSDINALSLSGDLLFMHKFKKQGRTFSVNLNGAYTPTAGNADLKAVNTITTDTLPLTTNLDQQYTINKLGTTAGTTISYTEPVSAKGVVQLSYTSSYNFTSSDKGTFNYNSGDATYDKQDTALSNKFNSLYATQKAGLSYRYGSAKLNFMAGVNYQYATLTATEKFPTSFDLARTYNDILPMLMLRYNITMKKSLRFVFRRSTSQPGIEQLQNVVDNTNPLQLTSGNANLRQTSENNIFMRYSSSNTEKGTSFFGLIAASYTDNYIGNSTFLARTDTTYNNVFLSRGTQFSQPVNINGFYSVQGFLTYGIPVKALRSTVNLNLNAGLVRTPGLVNGLRNNSDAQSYGGGIGVNSNISKQVDFSLTTNATYNVTNNSINSQQNSIYYNQSSRLKLNLIFLKNVVFATDLNHQYYSGLSAGYNQNFLIWNAGLGYKFLEDQKAELRFSVNDILGQNTSIARNTTETYIEDVRTTVLQRFYMLTFTYNLRKFLMPDAGREEHGPRPGQ